MSNKEPDYKVDIDIDKAIGTFKIDLIGLKSNESYKGVFQVKCLLNPMAFISADKLYRDLVGGKPHEAHEHARALAFALSQLKYRVIKMPPFWESKEIDGGHIDDDNIIMEILNRAIYCEGEFIKMKKDEAARIEKELTDDIMSGLLERQPELDSMEAEEQETEIDLEDE